MNQWTFSLLTNRLHRYPARLICSDKPKPNLPTKRLPRVLQPKILVASAVLTGSYIFYLWYFDNEKVPLGYPKNFGVIYAFFELIHPSSSGIICLICFYCRLLFSADFHLTHSLTLLALLAILMYQSVYVVSCLGSTQNLLIAI